MITNFEEFTYELTAEELAIVPFLMKGFSKYTKENPIKSEEIVMRTNIFLKQKGLEISMSGPRLRKIVNYLRSEGKLPVLANSKGYYVSYDREDIETNVKSLRERAASISKCADGLSAFLPVHNL